ncbi:hypothetical protein C2G38_2220592 [Gigaspora rosea]|uniref:Uncharacterized protein n=1 Tax=Gigaspora rosea TaxID=44941 RepID=A0A397U7P3_9GLOM|nr:hypothetical protein C2G38_2220592 [Gigaspora rosea]
MPLAQLPYPNTRKLGENELQHWNPNYQGLSYQNNQQSRTFVRLVFKIFLNITPMITNWFANRKEFSLVFDENPLAEFVELSNNRANNELWSLVEILLTNSLPVAALSTPIPKNIENILIDHINGLKPEGEIDLKTISTSDDIYKKARGGRAKTVSEIVFEETIPIDQEFLSQEQFNFKDLVDSLKRKD